MLRTILIAATLSLMGFALYGQTKVGDNTLDIDPASILELESTSKGFLPSRLTSIQRDLQTEWDRGHIIYNTTDGCLQIYSGSSWECIIQGPQLDSTIYKYDGNLTSRRRIRMNGSDLSFDGSGDSIIITSDGRLGIGDLTPDAKLDVEGGTVKFSDYGTGTIIGQEEYLLGVDSEGNIIETSISDVGTDNQSIDTLFLRNDSIFISITNDGEDPQGTSLSPYLDNTDDQKIDLFQINPANELLISLEDDDEIAAEVDLSPYLDNTDEQYVDTFRIVSDQLELSLFGDNQARQTIDLTPYANTDEQTASEVDFTPAASIVATNVQDAIEEIEPDIYGTIDVHDDVDVTTTPPGSGDVLAWDGSNFVPQATDNGYTIFNVWAEESGALGNNNTEWSFGNGDETPLGHGIVIPVDCELFAMSLDHESGVNSTVRILKNSADALSTYQIVNTGEEQNHITFGTPLSFVAGDVINFKTISASAGGSSGRASAWFRIRSTPASTSLVNDLLDVSAGGITNNQVLIFDGSSFVPLTLNADNIEYDNSVSSLTAVTVQEAIDEINSTNTDDQQIDNLSLSGTTLSISLEDDGVAASTIDLSPILGSSDNIYNSNGTLDANRTVTLDGSNLLFSGTTDVIIEADGDVGIGTSTPGAKLDVDGSVKLSAFDDNTYKDTSSYLLGVKANGDVVKMNFGKNAGWFYAPAVTIDASAIAINQEIDIHQEYIDQFTAIPANQNSTGAIMSLPTYEEDELEYIVTFYDNAVLDNITVSSTGILEYDVIKVPFDNYTIVNVIIRIK